jgi:hypothetical protein
MATFRMAGHRYARPSLLVGADDDRLFTDLDINSVESSARLPQEIS